MPHNMRRYTGVFAHAGLQRARESAIAGAARRAAKVLESQGKGGDKHLIHVSDRELAAIRPAFGPSGRAGHRNPVTGLESFAPDDETIAGDAFPNTNSDRSVYTVPSPVDPATADAAADAGFKSLSKITPTDLNQASPPQDQTPILPSTSPQFPIGPLGEVWQSTAAASPVPPRPGAGSVIRSDGHVLVIPDEDGRETELRSPVSDLGPVAAAGRELRPLYSAVKLAMESPEVGPPHAVGSLALPFYVSLLRQVGTGGRFDYQREGNQFSGLAAEVIPGLPKFDQLQQYRPVSNFNVGLFCQQAGMSRDETLKTAGIYARFFSSNAKPDEPYGLDVRTRHYIEQGWITGQQGYFDAPAQPKEGNR